MAQGLKIVNCLSSKVAARFPSNVSHHSIFLTIGMAIIILDENENLRKQMIEYLQNGGGEK